jgi:plastocyanin
MAGLAVCGAMIAGAHDARADDAVPGTGTITGKVVWGGASAPSLPVLVKKGDTNVKDAAVCAVTDLPDRSLVVDPATKGVANAFAYLLRPKGVSPDAAKALLAASPQVVMDQKNCEFIPHAIALHTDQTAVFKSSDPVGHNVRATGFNNALNIALAPNGSTEKKMQAETRPIPVVCDIHPWMKGWVLVLDHPCFAVTGADGSFTIKNVPPGTHNLVVSQERVGFVTTGASRGQAVIVKAGAATDIGTLTIDPAKVK